MAGDRQETEVSSVEASGAGGFTIAENVCPILSNRWVNNAYKLLVLEAPALALAAKPGQFFHLACPPVAGEATFLRRPMSVYRIVAERRELQFLFKVQGPGTQGLAALEPGDTLDALGPLGRGFRLSPSISHLLIVARGVGLATMAPLAEEAVAHGIRVTAILSARTSERLMSVAYLREVGAEVVTVTDEDGSSAVPAIEALVRDLHRRAPIDLAATCGSNRLLLLLQRLRETLGIDGQIALEQHMGCALGMCFACVRPFRSANGEGLTYRRVCWDGPVFDVEEAISW